MAVDYADTTKSKEERVRYVKQTLLSLDANPRLLNKSAIARKLGVTHTTVCEDVADAKEQIRKNRNINDLDVSDDFREWLME